MAEEMETQYPRESHPHHNDPQREGTLLRGLDIDLLPWSIEKSYVLKYI